MVTTMQAMELIIGKRTRDLSCLMTAQLCFKSCQPREKRLAMGRPPKKDRANSQRLDSSMLGQGRSTEFGKKCPESTHPAYYLRDDANSRHQSRPHRPPPKIVRIRSATMAS